MDESDDDLKIFTPPDYNSAKSTYKIQLKNLRMSSGQNLCSKTVTVVHLTKPQTTISSFYLSNYC